MSKYKRKLNIKWFATTKLGIEELAKNTNFGLTSSDFRLMFYLLSKIDEDNKATVPKQTEISDEINISVRKSIPIDSPVLNLSIRVCIPWVETTFWNNASG